MSNTPNNSIDPTTGKPLPTQAEVVSALRKLSNYAKKHTITLNTPTKLDEILWEIFSNGRDELTSDFRVDDAKAALSAIINQIIGENEIALSPNGAHVKEGKLARNSLRTKQRQRAERMGFIVNKES